MSSCAYKVLQNIYFELFDLKPHKPISDISRIQIKRTDVPNQTVSELSNATAYRLISWYFHASTRKYFFSPDDLHRLPS